jgi:hypothetical protein
LTGFALFTPGRELRAAAEELLPAPEALFAPPLIVLLMALLEFAAGCSEEEAVSSADSFDDAF